MKLTIAVSEGMEQPPKTLQRLHEFRMSIRRAIHTLNFGTCTAFNKSSTHQ